MELALKEKDLYQLFKLNRVKAILVKYKETYHPILPILLDNTDPYLGRLTKIDEEIFNRVINLFNTL